MEEPRLFDLNIEKILESWESSHAVRELIANALDEQVLSQTDEVDIRKLATDTWSIRDKGRGLRYEHFTQNENPEKLKNIGRVIGKFGVGLKDALATLNRNNIQVEIESRYGIISLAKHEKHGFGDVITLHAEVSPPRDAEFQGTDIRLKGLSDDDVNSAKSFFLKFSNENPIENTRVGQILEKNSEKSRIYVAGLLVAEEENFAFSYNITSLTEPMRRALNRERTNVGRTAYTERIKSMLLQTKSSEVADVLAKKMTLLEQGVGSDEVHWKDVAVHATKILNASGRYLFVTASHLSSNADAIDHARNDGLQIVTLPDSIYSEVAGASDIGGSPIRDLGVYQTEWNESFQFDWVQTDQMTTRERAVFESTKQIVGLVGGLPSHVKAVRVSNTMRVDFTSGSNALGLWDPSSSSIVIRRDQLQSLEDFAGTLLHELAHARSGYSDVTRGFENALTDFLGLAAAKVVVHAQGALSRSSRKESFWRRLRSRP